MSSGFNVLIDYTIFSTCFIVFQLFDIIKNFFSGYIEIDILIYSRQSLGVYNVKGVIQVGLKETISHGLI
jgi:hypothetical protein